ncbi:MULTISPECIES: maleate cis-trans isomerase family protein [Streptomyces]|uniref:maleate cis-trans isomerase family protein n=1 Tax=Streptomyces TaxID=1883 RepID=UPI000CD3C08A|nr:decarboxylase [Streptomyces sp. ZL-24]POG46966.1 decarboxylase [Streptomyces sp. ZL-24]
MTAVGLLYPGHAAEDDFPRIEITLDTDIRLPLFSTEADEDTFRPGALLEAGAPDRLSEGVDELRLAGAEALVQASPAGSFVYGWAGAHNQIATLARSAGLPASSTAFGFVHAVRELGADRVAVAAAWPEDVTVLLTEFLVAGGAEVVAAHSAGVATAAEIAGWEAGRVKELALAADHPDAEVLLLPDAALHTAAYIPELEEAVGKPVLTANQVTVWEGLRLTDRRVWAPTLGTLFAARRPVPGAAEPKGIEVRE